MLDLQPIKARLAAATPGPWSLESTYFVPRIWAGVGKLFTAHDATLADCDLITHAPTDLAALVAEVERLRGAITAHAVLTNNATASKADRELWAVLDNNPA